MNIIVITGASSGIGREFAHTLDRVMGSKIDEFWLIARREDRLREVAESLSHDARVLPMDLTDEEACEALADELAFAQARVRMLINASGYGILGSFGAMKMEDVTGMVRLNAEALTRMTRLMIPFMGRGSRILQMASSAAFVPQTGFAVYAATKAYVLSLSKALGEELRPYGIYVTSVCPGPVKTEFFDVAEAGGTSLRIKKYFMTTPQHVVQKSLAASYRKAPEVVPTLAMKVFELACKLLPHGLILRITSALARSEQKRSRA